MNTAQEFSKTAEAVRAEPWGLTKAADYLTNLCNPTQGDPEPIKFNFFLNHKVITKLNPGPFIDKSEAGYDYAPGAPREITIVKPTAKELLKRRMRGTSWRLVKLG